MPIRTNRGRAAVYRRLWGWPLRSPRHLVATFVGVAVVAIAVAVVTANARGNGHHTAGSDTVLGTSSNSAAAGAGATTTTPPASSAPTPSSPATITATRLASPPETPASAPPAIPAIAVITQWGKLWVNHPLGMTNAAWLEQLRPFTTDEFFGGPLKTVNVANIDASEVTGEASVIRSSENSVEAMLPTNAPTPLYIVAVLTPDRGWLVSWYGPEPQQ